jgi:hypothetical protein
VVTNVVFSTKDQQAIEDEAWLEGYYLGYDKGQDELREAFKAIALEEVFPYPASQEEKCGFLLTMEAVRTTLGIED